MLTAKENFAGMPQPIPTQVDDGFASQDGMEMDRSDNDGSQCCNRLKFVHNGNSLTFTREPGLFNGKPHYIATNGAACILYHSDSGNWLYQPASRR